jgi:hypothetical protein
MLEFFMEIKNSLDWQEVHSNLRRQLSTLGWNPDLRMMLNNITNMVVELSKVEVEARRSKSDRVTQEKVADINKAINHLEQILLMAILMR